MLILLLEETFIPCVVSNFPSTLIRPSIMNLSISLREKSVDLARTLFILSIIIV